VVFRKDANLTNPLPVAPLLAETSSAHRLNALATDYVLLRAFTIRLGAMKNLATQAFFPALRARAHILRV
jgi:hypothetical protein